MKYNGISRRMFLQGTGNLLFTIPFLESLLPISNAFAQSTANNVRYIQFISQYGIDPSGYYGNLKGNLSVANNIVPGGNPVSIANLVDFPSPLSAALGADLSALRNKFSILRGLDIQASFDPKLFSHNLILPTCASINKVAQDYTAPPYTDQPSIDSVLASSSIVYPTSVPLNRRQIVIGAGTGDPESASNTFSWRKEADGVIRMIPSMKQTDSLMSLFQSGFTSTTSPTTQTNKQSDMMSAVFGDYKRVRDGGRISSDDKVKLDSYMSLIADIQKGLTPTQPPATATCKVPVIGDDSSLELQWQNQLRILAAALACNLTRVASCALVFDSPTSHGTSHALTNNPADSRYAATVLYQANIERFSRRVAFLMRELDQIPDNGATLLDNSIIYWNMEFGLASYWGQHVREDYPVFVGGGGGGKLQQGKYIDFRLLNGTNPWWSTDANGPSSPLRGLALNNLLVTFMNCMGLSARDYETVAGKGYGYYAATAETPLRVPDSNFWLTTAGRRSPLPYFYKGLVMG